MYGLVMNFSIEKERFIQMLHDPAGHWLTISNVVTLYHVWKIKGFVSIHIVSSSSHENYSNQKIRVFCKCRMPQLPDITLICCSLCKERFHGDVCIGTGPRDTRQQKKRWLCPFCTE